MAVLSLSINGQAVRSFIATIKYVKNCIEITADLRIVVSKSPKISGASESYTST